MTSKKGVSESSEQDLHYAEILRLKPKVVAFSEALVHHFGGFSR